MSTRELQIIEALQERLETVVLGPDADPLAAIYLGREDLWGDDLTFPCASILHEGTEPAGRNRSQYEAAMQLSVVGVTKSEPTAPLVAGHALWQALSAALFLPSQAIPTGHDRLGGLARSVQYAGHSIAPREDGGVTTAVLITLRIEYVLDASNPSA